MFIILSKLFNLDPANQWVADENQLDWNADFTVDLHVVQVKLNVGQNYELQ